MDIKHRPRPVVPRISLPSAVRCTPLLTNRTVAGIVMACPFVVCFALFGTFNLIAGTILTAMACRPRSLSNILLHDAVLREYSKRLDNLLDPLKIVGPILLITGAMLVVVGISLGVVACRSAHLQRGTRHVPIMNGPASYSGAIPASITSALTMKKAHHLAVPIHKPVHTSPILPHITKIEMHRLDVVGDRGQDVRMCDQETSMVTSYNTNCSLVCTNCHLEVIS